MNMKLLLNLQNHSFAILAYVGEPVVISIPKEETPLWWVTRERPDCWESHSPTACRMGQVIECTCQVSCFISVVIHCYLCKKISAAFTYCWEIQLITQKCSGRRLSVRSKHYHHHYAYHRLSPCYVPSTVRASSLALPLWSLLRS